MRTVIRQLDHKASYGIWIYYDNNKPGPLTSSVAKPVNLEFTEVSRSFMLPEPTIEISYIDSQSFLQSLVNELIRVGVRPDSDRTAGELEATKTHLKDCQKFIDRLLNQLDKK